MGFDDSKQLKEEQRERFFNDIRGHPSIGWVIEELDAVTISKEMLRASPISLNLISYNAVIRMLETIRDAPPDGREMTVTDVFVDTVGDPDYYKSILVKAMGEDFATKFTGSCFKYLSICYYICTCDLTLILCCAFFSREEGRCDIQSSFCGQYYRESDT